MNNLSTNTFISKMTPTKRQLGQILLDGGFISDVELKHALHWQSYTNELLGDILVQMGVLDPADLKAVLSINKDLVSLQDALRLSAGVRRLLGELLLQSGRITPQQLEDALQEHYRTGKKLGTVLVRLGLISSEELNAVLEFQKYQEPESPTSDRLKLGEILVTTGQITRNQLEDALTRQRLSQKTIGDELVDSGYIQPHQLFHGLKLQKKLLKAALVAVLSLVSLSSSQSADYKSPDIRPENTVVATSKPVQHHTALKIVSQTDELIITQNDVMRGYVDIPIGAHVEIVNENLAGYMVIFENLGGPFKEVIVKGLGGEVVIDSKGGWITQPYNGRDPLMVELGYRFILSENAKPGTYAWPLTISVSPILPA
jgi:hypothetical protein